jgi:inner membrane protein
MLPVWAVLLGLIMALASRRAAAWRYYAMVCGLSIGIHILGDLITSFGTMILAPVSSARFSLGTTFIIDLFLSGMLIVGLAAAALWRHSRVPAVAALVAVCAYVGGQAWLREQAIGVGIRYAHSQGIENANVEALPRPPLPSNWMVVVSRGEEYRYANVNLWRSSLPIESPEDGLVARINAAFFPPAAAAWERRTRFGDAEADRVIAYRAWEQNVFAFYRWFAELPALHRIDRGNPSTCVWFEDLRFLMPGRPIYPFRYGLCSHDDGPWQTFRLTSDDAPEPLH